MAATLSELLAARIGAKGKTLDKLGGQRVDDPAAFRALLKREFAKGGEPLRKADVPLPAYRTSPATGNRQQALQGAPVPPGAEAIAAVGRMAARLKAGGSPLTAAEALTLAEVLAYCAAAGRRAAESDSGSAT